MQNRNYIYILLLLIFVAACKSPEARRPVQVKSGSSVKTSVERNKELYAAEEMVLKAIMQEDTLNNYLNSEYGFWYYYVNDNTEATQTPEFGDLLEFVYDIKDIYGNTIYSKKELGKISYRMDKEEIITGLREGLKLMHEGETITFIFPSYKAYGYYGDMERIGANMPIVSTVTLHNIENNLITKP
ncbi:MAG TPA: gliding motility-associated peptidyl-prolyl isomerase GldI [Flavobacteriaceae bacterium]|nr:gliding motility-associated peptidyl-prolyl isomerase GldI [Flavobacteriaceae bacterium]